MSSRHDDIGDRGGLSVAGVLTPKATSIAALAFGVLSMQGQGTWSQALGMLFWSDGSFPVSQVPLAFAVAAFASLLLAVVAGLLAAHTLRDRTAAGSWEGHLARAALLVAAAGAALSVLGVLGGVVRGLL